MPALVESGASAGAPPAVEGCPPPAPASLSPSRAADFMSCPLLYRFRVIDRLPERPSPEAARGTLVHAVLQSLFDLPPVQRTPAEAVALLDPHWQRMAEREPEVAALFGDAAALQAWLGSAAGLLRSYFTLEDPRRLAPAERESLVEAVLPSGLRLRGYVDRLDRAASGAVRIVDYKTGRSPSEAYEAKALFQMKFYALVLWRATGQIPALLQLVYLADRTLLRYAPDEQDLAGTERKLEALWAAISRAAATGDWRERPGRLCDWCDHRARCPAWGGTPPPLPTGADPDAVRGVSDRR